MLTQPHISILDMVKCLAEVMDLVSRQLDRHHQQVGYAAFEIGREAELPMKDYIWLAMAGMLHDCGILSAHEEDIMLNFEADFRSADVQAHALRGANFLASTGFFAPIVETVRFHHLHWEHIENGKYNGHDVPRGAQILHLADRVSISIDPGKNVLDQTEAVVKKINDHSGTMFDPELVDVFNHLAKKEYFWLDLSSEKVCGRFENIPRQMQLELDPDGLQKISKAFSHLIDFRSSFTATHSAGVAASAVAIADLAGFSKTELHMMETAGNIHDLGKLSVPKSILEKPGKLTGAEFNVMRGHTYHGYRAFETLPELNVISEWAFLHHERLDGSGYPFHYKKDELSLGARIMCIADVFAALTEDRPYRDGMPPEKAFGILKKMADEGKQDADILSIMEPELEMINTKRAEAQEEARESYTYMNGKR